MSSDDEYTDLKILYETVAELAIINLIAKRAVTTGLFKPDELKVILNKGKRSVETGLCDLRRILGHVDQSNFDTSIRQIIHGAINIGACWVVTQSRLTSSRGGKKGSKKTVEEAEKWKQHVRKCVAELFSKNPSHAATTIRNSIKTTRPSKINLPNDRHLYEFILAELKALKHGIK
jgi:hypothetical protein